MAQDATPSLEEEDPDPFDVVLDSMIESTTEFIADDGLHADEERVHDLSALLRVRKLWAETFKPQDIPIPNTAAPGDQGGGGGANA